MLYTLSQILKPTKQEKNVVSLSQFKFFKFLLLVSSYATTRKISIAKQNNLS